MKTVFTKEELDAQLKELKSRQKAIQSKRVSALEKYSKKQTASEDAYSLELQIEDIERKLSILF